MSVLVLERVSKRFDQALPSTISASAVAPGTVFGFLGGNGAGKTTSLRMVLDIIRPTSGRIEVLGRAPGRANAPEIGFLPEERGLYRQMTALDTIAYFGRLKGMTTADAKREGAALLDRFGLDRQRQDDASTSCRRAWRRRSSSRPRWSIGRGC